MKKSKRLLATLLTFILIIGLIPMNVYAEEDYEGIEIVIIFRDEEQRKKFEDDHRDNDEIKFVTPPGDYNIEYDFGVKLPSGGYMGNSATVDYPAMPLGYNEAPKQGFSFYNIGTTKEPIIIHTEASDKRISVKDLTIGPQSSDYAEIALPKGLPLGQHRFVATFYCYDDGWPGSGWFKQVRATKWIRINFNVYQQYLVSFNPNGAYWDDKTNSAPKYCKTDENGRVIDFPEMPKNGDRGFMGWYIYTPGSAEKVYVDRDTIFTKDTMLIPDWAQGPQSITINKDNLKDIKAATDPIELTLSEPGNGSGRVTWTSSDPSIASISGDTLTPNKAGTITLTARKAASRVGSDRSQWWPEAMDSYEVEIGLKQNSITIEDNLFNKRYVENGIVYFPLEVSNALDNGANENPVKWSSSSIPPGSVEIETYLKDGVSHDRAKVVKPGGVTITAEKPGDGVYADCFAEKEMWIQSQSKFNVYSDDGGTTDYAYNNRPIYGSGDEVKVRAIPDEGYHFDSWVTLVGGVADVTYAKNDNPVTFLLRADTGKTVNVMAQFMQAESEVCKTRIVKREEIPAKCTTPGTKVYYECECGSKYEDTECTVPIDNLDKWKAKGGRGYIQPLEHDWEWTNKEINFHARRCKNDISHYEFGKHNYTTGGRVCDDCGYYRDSLTDCEVEFSLYNGNSIIAICKSGKHEGRADFTFSRPNEEYSGYLVEAIPRFSNNWTDAEKFCGLPYPSITYGVNDSSSSLTNGRAVNAGNYSATASIGGVTLTKYFTISKATPRYNIPSGLTETVGKTLGDVSLPDGFAWVEPAETPVGAIGQNTFHVTYTPEDTTNYKTVENIEVTVTVSDKTLQNLSFAKDMITKTYGDDTFTQQVMGAMTDVTYESSNTSVATVDENTGEVTIIGAGEAIITAKAAENETYEGLSKGYTLFVDKVPITITAKDKTAYVGDPEPALGADDFTVNGLLGDDKLSTKPSLAYEESPDMSRTGKYKITASGADAGTNYEISYVEGTLTIAEKQGNGGSSVTVTKIELKSKPTKTIYKIGESLDLTGAKITVTKSDSTTEEKDVTAEMVSGFNSSTAGSKTVTVTYEGKTTSFTVMVNGGGSGYTPSPAPTPSPGPTYTPIPTPTPTQSTSSVGIISGSENGGTTISGNTSNGNATVADIPLNAINNEVNASATPGNIYTSLVIDVSKNGSDGKEVTQVTLTKNTIENISKVLASDDNHKNNLVIKTGNAEVTFDVDAVKAIADQAKAGKIQIALEKTAEADFNVNQRRVVESLGQGNDSKEVVQTFDISIISGDEKISDFRGGNVTVAQTNFAVPAGKKAEHFHVYYIPTLGEAVRCITWVSNGRIHFNTGHFSDYVIVYDENIKNGQTKSVYRIYNPGNGDHVFTVNKAERDAAENAGWIFEGVIFDIFNDGKKVYRLFNRATGEHFFTADQVEKDALVSAGWILEGAALISEGETEVYRLLNPGGMHMFTTSKKERDALVKAGWINEGVAFLVH